jgi:REP element-mobilizing transposase RayT
MEKFRGKYRISSARLKTWDYSSEGIYFITICTKNRENYLGEIVSSNKEQNEMELSVLGKEVEMEWLRTPEIRPDMNLSLGEYQVMPNHFHAILIIGENKFNIPANPRRDAMLVSLTDSNANTDVMFAPLTDSNQISDLENQIILQSNTKGENKFEPQSKNLGSVMRGFKSSVSSFAKDNNIIFNWQPRYYDHVIRNHNEYMRISTYIRNNPANWKNDRLR